MSVIVTGAAGFIGFHVAQALCKRGIHVHGVDNLNSYYAVALKQARLAQLEPFATRGLFTLHQVNIAETVLLDQALSPHMAEVTHIIHLAAQAGVRYSLDHPMVYAESNLTGHLAMLEVARHAPALKHFIYASSSSVYGGHADVPFSTDQRVDTPISLYAATKRANELMSYSYSYLYKIPTTGLRFFTVYGPWGRPDMAYYLFTGAIAKGQTVRVFAEGKLQRDFTYIDDIVQGILQCMERIPRDPLAPHKIYNLGNDRSERVETLIELIEKSLGKKAHKEFLPMQPGDMPITHADITLSRKELGYNPATTLQQGVPQFVQWYQAYEKSMA